MLVGCGGPKKTYVLTSTNVLSNKYYSVEISDNSQIQASINAVLQKCKNAISSDEISKGFENKFLEDACVLTQNYDKNLKFVNSYSENASKFLENNKQTVEDYRKKEKLAWEKNAQLEAVQTAKKTAEINKENKRIRDEKISKLNLQYAAKCKKFKQGSSEYENCLFENEKLAKEEQKRLANLPPSERYAYTCEKTYGFKKGSDNFRDCVFKIMTTEYEMQNQLNQRRIAELERKVASNQANTAYQNEMLEIERMKAKAMQDQVSFARNKDITDTLLGISSNLLSTPNRSASNAPQIFNCQTRKFGGFDQIQCF